MVPRVVQAAPDPRRPTPGPPPPAPPPPPLTDGVNPAPPPAPSRPWPPLPSPGRYPPPLPPSAQAALLIRIGVRQVAASSNARQARAARRPEVLFMRSPR